MLPTIIRALQPLASSRALHLVVGLYISGALLLLSPDDRLLIPLFLLQRGIVIVLLWPIIGFSLAEISATASIAVALIYLITVWRLYHRTAVAVARGKRGAAPLTFLPLRALAVALALLLTHGLLQRYAPALLPSPVSSAVAWLLVEFCFALFLAPTALHSGLGVLAFADAGRILYALIGPEALVWGLWAACDVLVALATAHLRTVEVASYGRRRLHRKARKERKETMEVLASQEEIPAASPEAPLADATGQDAAAGGEPPEPSALSAVSALEESTGQPETGDVP